MQKARHALNDRRITIQFYISVQEAQCLPQHNVLTSHFLICVPDNMLQKSAFSNFALFLLLLVVL